MSNIKSVTFVGSHQTYDLEINHPDHQYYLSNGMLTSNSHAVLYSMISHKTAYLKAHYPIEFLLANLMAEVNSNNPDASANIEIIKKEIRSHKVNILPPDINKSQLSYTLLDGNQLITGLDGIKFVGDEAIKDILEKRPFKDFFDFMVRVDSKKVRANNIQALAASGALDSFGITRKNMFLYVSDYRKKIQIWLKKHDPSKEVFVYPWVEESDWSVSQKYALEIFYIGEAFVCKPPFAYGRFFFNPHYTYNDVKKMDAKSRVSVRAIVKSFFEFQVKKQDSKFYGQSMVKATLEDRNGDQFSCTIFPDKWEVLQKKIKQLDKMKSGSGKLIFDVGLAMYFTGTVNLYENEIGIIFDQLIDLDYNPALPDDLKAKKVSLKEMKSKSGVDIIEKPLQGEDLLQKIEDVLYDEGLMDLDVENDD